MANSPRFDLAAASQLQSRDGGLTKGGLMRNGFVEKAAGGESWCWQRPPLVSTFSSPFAGTGQGFYVSAAALWGIFNNGTAYSQPVSGGTGRFTLYAGTVDSNVFGLDLNVTTAGTTTEGDLVPSTFAGYQVRQLYQAITADKSLQISMFGSAAQSRFTSFLLPGGTFATSTAAYSYGTATVGTGSYLFSLWVWGTVTSGINTGGTYAGTFSASGPATTTNTFAGISISERPDWAASISGPVMLKGTGTAYSVTGTTVTGISDTDYPTLTVRGVQYLDGTFYVMEPDGTIWNSLPAGDDPTSWPTDGFLSAEFEPDTGVYLAKALNYIVALGQWTVELFWDGGGTTGSPLLPVNNGVLLIGCASAGSVAQTEGTVIWMAQRKADGSTAHFGRFIAILVGTSYEELSTPDVSRVLEADDLESVQSSIVELGGHSWYLLSLGTSAITLVFDLKNKQWYVWTRLAAGSPKTITGLTQVHGYATGTSTSHGILDGDPVVVAGATPAAFNGTLNVSVGTSAHTFSYPVALTGTSTGTGASMTAAPYTESALSLAASLGFGGKQVVMDLSGNVYTLSLGTALDNGDIPLNWRVRTMSLDQGNTSNKFYSSLAVVGDVAGTATGLVRTLDKDYTSVGYFRRFDLSEVPCHENRFGASRSRAWEWRYTGGERYRLKALEPDITQGVT